MKKKLSLLLTIVGTATLAACGGPDAADKENAAASPAQSSDGTMKSGPGASEASGKVHTGNGDITAITDNKVTISHGPIPGIGWPSMTMPFSVGSPEVLQGLNIGDKVTFQFREAGSDHVITSINKAQ